MVAVCVRVAVCTCECCLTCGVTLTTYLMDVSDMKLLILSLKKTTSPKMLKCTFNCLVWKRTGVTNGINNGFDSFKGLIMSQQWITVLINVIIDAGTFM